MSGKAHYKDIAGRIREIRSDPCNQHIARIKRAGEIVDGHLVAHNGLQVRPFDSCYMELLQANGGCHEPQEEFVFQEVLKHIPRRGCILELGAYWAFYSMWFAREVPEARCLLVEPRRRNLEVGQYNFARNGIHGEFFRSRVGYASLGVDRFLAARQLGYIDLLHADIQGSEFEMLGDARESLKSGKIGYIFIGTHSQELHYRCKYYGSSGKWGGGTWFGGFRIPNLVPRSLVNIVGCSSRGRGNCGKLRATSNWASKPVIRSFPSAVRTVEKQLRALASSPPELLVFPRFA